MANKRNRVGYRWISKGRKASAIQPEAYSPPLLPSSNSSRRWLGSPLSSVSIAGDGRNQSVGGVTNRPAFHGSTLVSWHGLFDQRNPQFPFLWDVGASIGKERSAIHVQPRKNKQAGSEAPQTCNTALSKYCGRSTSRKHSDAAGGQTGRNLSLQS